MQNEDGAYKGKTCTKKSISPAPPAQVSLALNLLALGWKIAFPP